MTILLSNLTNTNNRANHCRWICSNELTEYKEQVPYSFHKAN